MVSLSASLAALLGRTAGKPRQDAPKFQNDIRRSETVLQAGTVHNLHLQQPSGNGAAARPWRDYWHPDTTGANFVGREGELEALTKELESTDGIAKILSIQGMAGIGKTELAVAYVHLNKHRYDGRVFFDFQSYGTDRLRVTAEQALARMLPTVAGLAPEEVERLDGPQLLAVWHAVTAGRRLLMVWDNVKHPDQVRPLLVRNDGCSTLIVSRDTIAIDFWKSPMWIDVLAEADAVELARQILGDGPPDVEVLQLVRGNMFVPVLIASHARAVQGGTMTLREVLAELPDTSRDLDVGSQRDLFDRLDGSYFNLDPEQRLAFRAIGSHPGLYATLGALAAVLRCEVRRARELMDGLVLAGLLTRFHLEEDAEDLSLRAYNCHDLLRSYGAHRARRERDEESILEALVDHYQARLDAYADADYGWYLVESANIRDTALAGEDEQHARLAQSLGWLSYNLGHHGVAVTVFQHALEVLGEDAASSETAMVRLGLGHIALAREDWALANAYYHGAADGFLLAEERYWQATAVRGMGYGYVRSGGLADALEILKYAVHLFEDAGDVDLAAEVAGEVDALEAGLREDRRDTWY